MKKLLIGICALSLLVGGVNGWAAGLDSRYGTATSVSGASLNAYKTNESAPKSKEGATATSRKGADYSKGAGNKAARTDMAIDSVGGVFSAIGVGSIVAQLVTGQLLQTIKQQLPIPILSLLFGWSPLYWSADIGSALMTLAHAAVNKWMRDAAMITADFTGTEGFTTDKWVGPHPRNKVINVMGDIKVTSDRFKALAFDPNEYKDVDLEKANARVLMEYREKELLEDQRSLSNVADAEWKKLYNAQQQSIKGLASAYELKEELAKLGKVERKISADYKNKPSALETVAMRRALYDSLMMLKTNVMSVRTKLRAHILEVDFKPKRKETDNVVNEEQPGGPSGVAGSGGS